MKVQPASLEQVVIGRNGKRVRISSDVGNVAKDLASIDSNLELHANEDGGYYEVRCFNPAHGKSYLVTTALELDQRIVDKIREISQDGYDYALELRKTEEENKKELDYQHKQKLGEVGEELAHAMRKDLGIKRIF